MMSILLSKKRCVETLNELKQQITILEQDKLESKENAAGQNERYFALEKKLFVFQSE